MYSIKNKPEDFVVIEKNKQLEKEYKEHKNNFSKKYLIFKLKKNNIDHITTINKISKFFKINEKDIGIAGIKDKKAITEQYISIKNYNRIINKIEKEIKDTQLKTTTNKQINKEIKITKNIILIPLFSRQEHIFKGFLDGNQFKILIQTKYEPKKKTYFLNYFGEQRFSKSNIKLGKYLIKREYEKFIKHFSKDFNGKDYVNWINKNINKKIIKFYIHAYQSYLWNKIVKEIFENKAKLEQYKNLEIPILGFEAQETKITKEITKKYNKIIKKEKISPRNFIFSDIQNASSAGDKRKAISQIKNLKIIKIKKGYIIEFFLEKGSYATEFIKQIIER